MGNVVYGTGLAMEIPEGHVGLLFARSSNSKKTLWLTNFVGIIDSGYRGEVKMKFRSSLFTVSWWTKLLNWLGLTGINFTYCACEEYEVGDKIGQLIIMPYPKIEFEQVDWLTPSDRSEGSYGSTGR